MSATTIRPPKGWTAAEVHICVRGLSAENPFEMKPVDGYVCDAAPGLAISGEGERMSAHIIKPAGWSPEMLAEWDRHHGSELPRDEFRVLATPTTRLESGVRFRERRTAHRPDSANTQHQEPR